MTIQLTEKATVALYINKEKFLDDKEDGTYFNIPVDYFDFKNHEVILSEEVAGSLKWIKYETISDQVVITTAAQTITVNGKERSINPGLGGVTKQEFVKGEKSSSQTKAKS